MLRWACHILVIWIASKLECFLRLPQRMSILLMERTQLDGLTLEKNSMNTSEAGTDYSSAYIQ